MGLTKILKLYFLINYFLFFKNLFATTEGRVLKNRKKQVEAIEEFVEGRSLEGPFFFITQKLSNLVELKSCIGGGFWIVSEGLYEFFKFNSCCYNTLLNLIKNILIISIYLSSLTL
jgi:hypothetical protein